MCNISSAHNSWIFSCPTLTIAVHYSRGITFISRPTTQKRFIEASGLFCKFLSKHSYHQDRWRIFFSTGLNSSSTNLRNVDAAFVRTISMTWNWYRVLPTVKADFFPSHMTPIQLGKWVTGHNKCLSQTSTLKRTIPTTMIWPCNARHDSNTEVLTASNLVYTRRAHEFAWLIMIKWQHVLVTSLQECALNSQCLVL